MADKSRFASLSLEENEKCETSFVFMTRARMSKRTKLWWKMLGSKWQKSLNFKVTVRKTLANVFYFHQKNMYFYKSEPNQRT